MPNPTTYTATLFLKSGQKVVLDHLTQFITKHHDGKLLGIEWVTSERTKNKPAFVGLEDVAAATYEEDR